MNRLPVHLKFHQIDATCPVTHITGIGVFEIDPNSGSGDHCLMIDHDRLFKELLSVHIWEFIELLMPEVAAFLDKSSLQLADKELFSDIPGFPRQEADLVFKGKLKGQSSAALDNY